jgi:phosphoglycolate phosphatase-like HAD superfamily hydrolase
MMTIFAILASTLGSSVKAFVPSKPAMTRPRSSPAVVLSASDCALVPNPPPTKTAGGVIFDIDGTLADSWRLGYDATVVVLENNKDRIGDVEINEKIYHETCVYATPERLARTAGYDPYHPDFEELGNDLGAQFDDHYVALVSKKTASFYDGILPMLENLPEGTKLGALTNACVAYAHNVLKVNCPVRSALDNTYGGGFALYGRFGTIQGADSVPEPKPSPKGLLQCAKEVGLDPADCIYVGDAIGDGRAARAAGMVSVGVTWGSNSEEKLKGAQTFDYLCNTVDELRALLPQQA